MALSARAKKLVAEITKGNLKLGDLKKRGTEIKKDHDLAMELITRHACAGSGKLLPGKVQTCLIPWKTIWLTLNPKFNGP
jgi:hypothetical protein